MPWKSCSLGTFHHFCKHKNVLAMVSNYEKQNSESRCLQADFCLSNSGNPAIPDSRIARVAMKRFGHFWSALAMKKHIWPFYKICPYFGNFCSLSLYNCIFFFGRTSCHSCIFGRTSCHSYINTMVLQPCNLYFLDGLHVTVTITLCYFNLIFWSVW